MKLTDFRAEIGFNAAGVTTINLYAVAGYVGNVQRDVLGAAREVVREAKRRWNKRSFSQHATIFPGVGIEEDDARRLCTDMGLLRRGA